MGQSVTLFKAGLTLPLIASLGFVEDLVVTAELVWLAGRYHRNT